MTLSLGSSCMFVDLTQHCNQVMYAYIYEPHAYHNLLLPKISAQIQRYGFQAEPESWNPSLYPASDGGWVYLMERASVQ